MELTQEQTLQIQQKIVVAEACPNCGCTDEKAVDPHIYELMSHSIQDGIVDIAGDVNYQALLAVRCPRCSFTSLFNLKALGIL